MAARDAARTPVCAVGRRPRAYPVTFMKKSVAPHTIAKASTITR
jgi:hypothetical protein